MTAVPRLFVAASRFSAPAPLRLEGPEHHYLSRVLRLGVGDQVVLLDGQAQVATTRIASITHEVLELEWLSIERASTVNEPQVTLYMGLCKGEKPDLIVQKATELGARRIVNVVCQRSVPELGQARAMLRQQRWQRIAQAAAQQCRRPDLPEVTAPLPLLDALRLCEDDALRLMLYEGTAPSLRSVLGDAAADQAARIALFIGPEGGLAAAEIDALQAAGFVPCSLGPRVLRAETAALAALAVVLSA